LTRVATLDALIDEIDQALTALRSAQQMLEQLRRSPEERQSRLQVSPTGRRVRDLRFSGMTVAEAAVALGVSEEHVRRLLRRGELVGVGYGGRIGWRLPRDYVLDLAAQLASAREGHDQARQRIIPGSRPPGRPPKQRVGTRRPRSAR
jgi:excisionase family DNA binding protein